LWFRKNNIGNKFGCKVQTTNGFSKLRHAHPCLQNVKVELSTFSRIFSMGFLLAEFVVIKHDKHSGCILFKKLHLKNDGFLILLMLCNKFCIVLKLLKFIKSR
jgi:hypothetical protein